MTPPPLPGLPGATPPPLPSDRKPPVLPKQGQPTRASSTRGRRIARRVVWGVFALVLVAAWFHPPDFRFRQDEPFPGGPRRGGEGRRFRREPARLQAPVRTIPNDLWRLEIEIAPENEALLRQYEWNPPMRRGGAPLERPEVAVTVREGGHTYTNVSLHLKGSMGSFRPYNDKPAITLNFSKNAKEQKFHGYTKISLNNSVQDSTYISEIVSRELFNAAGVPVPSARHATVVINGRDLNLYVVVEGWSKTFLKRHFSNVRGNLYEGGFASDIAPDMEVVSGDSPQNRDKLEKLVSAVRISDPKVLWSQLEQVLDVHRFARMMAMEVLTCHWDGYSINRNNYRIFHDLEADRLVFMPHGMDQMFGSRGRMPPTSPLHLSMQGVVARAFLRTADGRKLYREQLAFLSTNILVESAILKRLEELAQQIRPTLAAYGSDWARQHDFEVQDFANRISERCESVSEQMKSTLNEIQEIQFDAAGVAPLRGWRPRGDRNDAFTKTSDGGSSLLQIHGVRGTSTSWRTSMMLGPGSYRFEGRARIKDVQRPGGVRLRISGVQSAWVFPEAADATGWLPLEFEFEILEPEATVEFVCEFGNSLGEAQFEEASLVLRRR